ncbi:MAG: GDSL-type esterase/lipase family protein [Oscillospiraceae bacterium]|nr:GDSL-type esterase/lipase family protein [Oscillospiraceae bacterium]
MDIVASYVKIRASLMRHGIATADVAIIGGSSAEYWKTAAADLHPWRVVNFGIGGSTAAEWINFAPRLVPPCAPKKVFIYAGANDLHMKKETPEATFGHVKNLIETLAKLLPRTQLYYAGIYLTSKYRDDWESDRLCNTMAQTYAESHENVIYIDIPTVLCDADHRPLPNIFRADGEHLSEHGYALWRKAAQAAMRIDAEG